MAYTPVPTVNTGDLWTAANHNAYIKDNFAAGVPDLFVSKGDLVAATGNNAADKVTVGVTGSVLMPYPSADMGVQWRPFYEMTFPARARRVAAQSIGTGADVLIAYDEETFDPMDCFAGGGSARYTSKCQGYYQVNSFVSLDVGADADVSETLSAYLYRGGAFHSYVGAHVMEASPTGYFVRMSGSDIILLNVGQYIDVRIQNGTGATISLELAVLSVVRVG